MRRSATYSLCFALLLTALGLQAQQTPLSSLAFKDRFRTISAYAGLEGTLYGSALYRNQWQKIDGHPKGLDLSIHFPVYQFGSSAGIQLGKDQLGIQQSFYIKPAWNKIWKTGNWLIATGIQPEWYWMHLDGDLARTPDGQYGTGPDDHRDPLLGQQASAYGLFDLGLSIYIQKGSWEGGLAFEKILGSGKAKQPFPWANARSLKALAASSLSWDKWVFKPQITVFTDFNYLQTDLFTGFEYNGSIFGGVLLRGYNGNSLESLGIIAGFMLNKRVQIAYSHEIYIGGIARSTVSSSQELGLFYNFGKAFGLGKPPRVQYSPRYSD